MSVVAVRVVRARVGVDAAGVPGTALAADLLAGTGRCVVALLRDVLLLVVDRLLVLLLVDRTGRGGSWNGEVARGGVMMLPGTDGVVAVEAVVAVGEVGAIGGVHAGGELLRQWRAEFSTLKDKKKNALSSVWSCGASFSQNDKIQTRSLAVA